MMSNAPGNAPPHVLQRATSLNINDARIAGLYNLEHTIGKGNFAVVKLARHVFTGEKVAVKVIDKTRLDPVSASHMMQEVRCMKLVQHPNIVRLYEIIDTQSRLFLILELGDYDMYEYIMKKGYEKGGCKESDAQQYFSQIIRAIDYCHKLHVVHRDLKPENVVFFEKLGMVKLTDFGFSNMYTPGEHLQTSCGSLAYSAPEILLGDPYDAPGVDVWSIGVLLYMLVCGKLPFQEANESETLTRILDCKFSLPSHLSAACKQLIAKMLVRDPSKRATLTEIKSSSWVIAGDKNHADVLPLIARDQLPESAHCTIVEQMVAGGIGSEVDIISAIENGDYSYITATYYLLAERVLSSYRQEQANRLLAMKADSFCDENYDLSDSFQTTGSTALTGTKSRSRSNSWRGSVSNRRACTMVKEESEEELSSYLRTSRQSSRLYGVGSARQGTRSASHSLQASRANSVENFAALGGKPLSILEDEEEERPDNEGANSTNKNKNSISPLLLHPHSLQQSRRERSWKGRNAFTFPYSTAPSTPSAVEKHHHHNPLSSSSSGTTPRGRRNSSPSMSMLGATRIHSNSRERVSPQAIQELLEFSRLSSTMRRAASPESRLSSRSSSPSYTSHSGRASPAMISIVSRLKAASLLPGAGGMRKLSSSPHLLGICEENEEGSESPSPGSRRKGLSSFIGGASPSAMLSAFTNKAAPLMRSNMRSASMGLGYAYARRSADSTAAELSTSFDSSIPPISRSFMIRAPEIASSAASLPPLSSARQKKHLFSKKKSTPHTVPSCSTPIEPLAESTEEMAISSTGLETFG